MIEETTVTVSGNKKIVGTEQQYREMENGMPHLLGRLCVFRDLRTFETVAPEDGADG